MMYKGVDTAATISAEAAGRLKAEGVSFVGRYLVPSSMSKSLKADEIKGLRDVGLAILLCWEIGASDVKGGAERGRQDGTRAKELAQGFGVPAGVAIYFAVDYEAVQSEFPTIEAYIRAAGEACYPYAAGMYCHAALADYLGSKGACKYFWQCCAWSYGRVSGYMSAYQYAWSGAAESKAMAAAVGIPAVDMDSAESLEAAGLWLPPVTEYDDGDGGVTIEPRPTQPKEPWYAEAMAWAKDKGLINDGRPNDPVTRAELATVLFRMFGPEDNKSVSGLLTEEQEAKMKENIFIGALTLILAGAAAYFRQLLGPLLVLVAVMVIDYVTGIAAAWVQHELSSRTGILGIIKKISYLFAVAVAVVVDYVIASAIVTAKPELQGLNIFGLLVTVWLILNECISILENLSKIGVPLPRFLMAIVRRLKKSTETKGDGAADQIAPPVSDSDTKPEDLPEPEDYLTAFGVDGSLPPPFDPEEDLTDDHPPDAE